MGPEKKSDCSDRTEPDLIPSYLQGVFEVCTDGRRATLNELYEAAYKELRQIAASMKWRYRNCSVTLNPTALVNEVYVKLANSQTLQLESQLHLKCVAARAMRYVLLSAARSRFPSLPKGSSAPTFVTLTGLADPVQCDQQFVALHDALNELERLHSRQAAVVECRFFVGLTNAELAELLHVGESTIERDWSAAKAWLASEVRRMS